MTLRLKRSLLVLLRALGLFAIARRLTRDHLRILCYHGISIGDQYEYDPVLFMRREIFERRLRRIRMQGWRVVDLDTAVRELLAGTLQPNTLVITIDDGWFSTYTEALPLLKKYDLPATLYVTTYYAETGRDVFNVVVYYMAKKTRLERVRLTTGYGPLDGEYELKPDFFPVAKRWIDFADRELSAGQRQDLLPVIAHALQVDPVETLANSRFRSMSRTQIRDAAKAGVDIELHTHRHRLPAESIEAMKTEIEENKLRLEDWTGQPCEHFCYPSGDYTVQQSEWLAGLGLRSSTTCDPGENSPGQHPHRLKRVLDRDNWSDVEFDAELSGIRALLGR
jgi:peptidoglycan/xylan/chitin deacetylase (PgdA/CDA1 family)